MSIKHTFKIHSHVLPLDLPGGEILSERSPNGAAAPISNQTLVATGARAGEPNASAVKHDLAELVWKFFEAEIRESMVEVQEAIQA